MSNLKKQMDEIKIPETLHKRSLQGIHQAQKEQKKPSNWMPNVVASIVTFAAIGFIALSVGEREISQQTMSSSFVTSEIAPQMYWYLAVALLIVCMFFVRLAIGRGMKRKLGVISCVIMAFLLGNSAFFLQNQLDQPIVVPLVHDFYAENETHDLQISYLTNKSDHRSVRYLQAGELILMARYYDESQKNGLFYYPTDTLKEGNHQLLRFAYFVGSSEDIEVLIKSDEVFLVLDDGEKLATQLNLQYDSRHGNVLTNAIMTKGNSNGEKQGQFVLQQDALFDEVFMDELLKEVVFFEKMEVNQKFYAESDFPVEVKKGQRVTLFFKVNQTPMDLQTTIGVRGPNGILPISIHSKAQMDVKKIREELVRHDGS